MLDLDPNREAVVPRDAATVILLREATPGFAVFMVRRHKKSGFMGGAHVFPGGTLDEADRADESLSRVEGLSREAAAQLLGDDDPARALGLFVAAIRETFEEAGVLLAEGADAIDRAAARACLHEGGSFDALVRDEALTLRADHLAPWARWVTPVLERRRYDARFFLARSPAAQEAEHDRIEVTEGEWLRPAEALERWEAGSIQLPPPTLRTLEQLSAFSTIDEAFARAAEVAPPKIVMPHFVQMGDTAALTLPGDPEHPIAEKRIEGPSRFVLVDGAFRSRDPED